MQASSVDLHVLYVVDRKAGSGAVWQHGNTWRLWRIQTQSITWRCYSNEQRMPVKRFKQNQEFPKENALLLDKEQEVMLTCMGITYSMCCRDNTKITHIVASISFWTRWLEILCSFKWVLTPLKSVTFYFSTLSTQQLLDTTKYK